jgi:type IV secretion system protein TrbL
VQKIKSSHWAIVGGVLTILLFLIPQANALPTDNFIDGIIDTFKNGTSSWENRLQGYALRLFWLLAGIEFTWTAIRLALKGADLGDFLAETVNRIFYIGFFLTLLLNSANWSHAIVDSFRQAGNDAVSSAGGSGVIHPSNVMDTGMEILKRVSNSMSIYDPGDSIMLALAAIVILISFAGMTALLVIALVESYFIISSGIILMGFGGASWTNDLAINTIRYAISVGAKLFMVQLVIGLGQQLLNEWAQQAQTGNMDLDDVLLMAGACIVFLAITKVIPEMVQGLINGSSLANGHALSSTIESAIGAGMAAGATAFGLGSTVQGARDLSKEQMKEDENGKGGQSEQLDPAARLARTMALSTRMMGNTVKAGADNLAARARGEVRYGDMSAQMGHSMSEKAEGIRAFRELKNKKSNNESDSTPPQTPPRDDNRIYGQDDN